MSNPCITGCDDSLAQLYRPQDSSTTQDLNTPFKISCKFPLRSKFLTNRY